MMKRIKRLVSSLLFIFLAIGPPRRLHGQQKTLSNKLVVRLAELHVDPAQLEAYKACLTEEIQTSIKVEPGVLTLYAVAVKGHPDQIRLLEIYSDELAYNAHLQSLHFKKYKNATAAMVLTLQLIETDPIALGTRAH